MMTTAPLAVETMDSNALVQAELQPSVSLESLETEKRACERRSSNDATKKVAFGSYSAPTADESNSNLAKDSKNVGVEGVSPRKLSSTNKNDGRNSNNGMKDRNKELPKEPGVEDWQEVCYLRINVICIVVDVSGRIFMDILQHYFMTLFVHANFRLKAGSIEKIKRLVTLRSRQYHTLFRHQHDLLQKMMCKMMRIFLQHQIRHDVKRNQ